MIEPNFGVASAIEDFKQNHFGSLEASETKYQDLREKLTRQYNLEKDLKTRITLQNLLMELDDAYFDFAKRQMSKQLSRNFL
ncbi:MAG TPA: hypothetical protein VMV20_01910 [Chitinophagaceae bacterium]|nr:hypothetical protein [Chitinophagaceae bacterium]